MTVRLHSVLWWSDWFKYWRQKLSLQSTWLEIQAALVWSWSINIYPMHPVTISGLSQHLFSTGTESLSFGKIINIFGSKLGILGVFPNWEGSVYQTQLKEIDGPENIHVHMSISTGLGPVLAKYIFRQCIVTSFFHA